MTKIGKHNLRVRMFIDYNIRCRTWFGIFTYTKNGFLFLCNDDRLGDNVGEIHVVESGS